MLEDEIKKRVESHYKESTTPTPLLLSQFGKSLRVEGLWPIEGETRNLKEVIEGLRPAVDVIRDPNAPAFAVVVAQGSEEIANDAIRIRQATSFLENLPRSVLLAFVANNSNDGDVYLQVKSPFRYHIGAKPELPDYRLVDDNYRLIGERIDRVRDLAPAKRERLSISIRQWAEACNLSLDIFYRPDTVMRAGSEVKRESSSHLTHERGRSFLERLQAAQPEGVAEKMVIPIDIALALSRLR